MQQGKATVLGIMIMNDAKSYTAVLKTVKRLLNGRSKHVLLLEGLFPPLPLHHVIVVMHLKRWREGDLPRGKATEH